MGGTAGDGGATTGGFAGARTPEDLETLFEDAFVMRDCAVLTELFEERAVLVAGDGRVVRGSGAIAGLVAAMWERDRTYVADPRRVVQARDLALILGERAINVARRGGDGSWRYAIAFLCAGDQSNTTATMVGE
jgi:hypothetical protein